MENTPQLTLLRAEEAGVFAHLFPRVWLRAAPGANSPALPAHRPPGAGWHGELPGAEAQGILQEEALGPQCTWEKECPRSDVGLAETAFTTGNKTHQILLF